jgi:RNA polymerase sigma-70 factor (ECF subfamily)
VGDSRRNKNLEEASAEKCMLAYVQGEPLAFESLYRIFAPRLYRYFLAAFRDPTTAAELFQITFFKAHRGRHSYRPGSPVAPWLFTIAERVRTDELRRRGREASRRRNVDPEVAAVPVEPVLPQDEGLKAIVRRAVETLPEGQREVIVLHKLEDLPLARVAEVLGITEGAAKVRAHRAYAALRKVLGERLADVGAVAGVEPAREPAR